MQVKIVFGATLCAYTTEVVEVPDNATAEDVREIARKTFHEGDLVFDEDWSSADDHRIVEVSGFSELQDTPIETPIPVFAMKGDGSIRDVIGILTHVCNGASAMDRASLGVAVAKLMKIQETMPKN